MSGKARRIVIWVVVAALVVSFVSVILLNGVDSGKEIQAVDAAADVVRKVEG